MKKLTTTLGEGLYLAPSVNVLDIFTEKGFALSVSEEEDGSLWNTPGDGWDEEDEDQFA